MCVESIPGVRVTGVSACLPSRTVDAASCLTGLTGDAAQAASVVATTGIASLRIADPGVSPLDLCTAAAERLFARLAFDRTRLGAVVFVSFTSPFAMPAAAALSQARLGLPEDIPAFDVGLACSGYVYGLHLAALLARQSGRPVLLLDGDVQSRVLKPDDVSTVPILADAGTATLVEPDSAAPEMRFAFLTRGKDAAALTCPAGGSIAMDGLAIFKFVSTDVSIFLRDFLASIGVCPQGFDAFVPHQANVYLVRRLAKSIGFSSDSVWIAADRFGNSASATIPVTLAHAGGLSPCPRRILLAGFGGGLSVAAADVTLSSDVAFDCADFEVH